MFDMIFGNVTWFDAAKGYGFIRSGEKDYFAHFRCIAMQGFKELKQGQTVKFNPKNSDKGMIADNIVVVSDDS